MTFSGNMAEPGVTGGPHRAVEDIFLADGVPGALTDLRFDPATLTTTLTTKDPLPAGTDYARRAIRLGDNLAKGGQWRVIARASGRAIVLWGRLDAVTKAPAYFEILRTFTPGPGSPAGLGARSSR